VRRSRKPGPLPERTPGHLQWLLTFNDMVTNLTVFFIMLFAMSSLKAEIGGALSEGMRKGLGVLHEGRREAVRLVTTAGQTNAEPVPATPPKPLTPEKAPERSEAADQALQLLAGQQGLSVTPTASGVLLTLEDGLLFDSGRAEIRQQGQAVLDRVAAALAPINATVRVEGHTDDAPIQTRTFPSNWELSMSRAVNVVKYLAAQGALAGQRLSAVGYADSRPLVPNTGPEGRARNRRVEIVAEMAALGPAGAGVPRPQRFQQPNE